MDRHTNVPTSVTDFAPKIKSPNLINFPQAASLQDLLTREILHTALTIDVQSNHFQPELYQ